VSRRRPGHPFAPPAPPAAPRPVRDTAVRVVRALRRPATLLVGLTFAAGLVAGGSSVLRDREAAGLLEAPATTTSPALLAAADRIEALLAGEGFSFAALQVPYRNAAPSDTAGVGAYTVGGADADGGYLAMSLVLEPLTATLDAPGALDPFRREVAFLGDAGLLLRRASARPVDPADPASVAAARFETVTTPVGMGIDNLSVRSLPRLLRTMQVERDEATTDGGHLYAGSAPAASYPGAVASDLIAQTNPLIGVLVRLDADGNLTELGLRAVNSAIAELEYVTLIRISAPLAPPAWREEARP